MRLGKNEPMSRFGVDRVWGRVGGLAVLILGAGASFAAAATASAALDAPTWTGDVAAVMHNRCVACHQPGEIGPMSLRTYDEARPWAKSIGRNVADRVMPPWDADPGFGPFVNDRSLSPHEMDTIMRWVDAGAPRGTGEEPTPPPPPAGEWKLGTPDWVIEFDPVEVAADGADSFYQFPIDTGFTEDRFIRAVEVLPGARSVVHHFLLWQGDESGRAPQSLLGGWAAGAEPVSTPDGTARLVKQGHKLIGDFHYHPAGEAATDRTRIGLYFADTAKVEKELVNLWVLNADFNIPAGDPNYEARATYVFPQDITVFSLTPHMHFRGKDMVYVATLPDGTSRELLRVSAYDFNWQTAYDFAEPVDLPAGTRLDVVAHWDNSTDNQANPDPSRNVSWGIQSTDEMLIGFVDYVVKEGLSPRPVSLVIGKLVELAERFPGQVWRIDAVRQPGKGPEPMALHIPRTGPGGWYVQLANMVLPAPIRDIVWEGNHVTALADIPGSSMELEGTLDPATGELALTLKSPGGTGQAVGKPAEAEVKQQAQSLPSG